MKLRLYVIRDTHTRQLIPGLYFTDKPGAKKERDAMNDAAGHKRYVVSLGPDHYRFKSAR